jgi:hypothetical protein
VSSEDSLKFTFADAAANGAPWMLVIIQNPDGTPWGKIQQPKLVVSGNGVNLEVMKLIIAQMHESFNESE